jgi:GntR family transcriptional repressor for pyruvate dehydrogenase complex
MANSTRRTLIVSPVRRSRLPDDLAERIKGLIRRDNYAPGDRLPAIATLAREFGVGAPTVREALKRLEMAGTVSIRHGSGVYVGREDDSLLMSNPVFSGAPSKQLLLDLIEARSAIEVPGAARAAVTASAAQLDEMDRLLAQAEANLDNDDVLNATNMAFHRLIAESSGNVVFRQLLEVLTNLFTREQRAILDIQNQRADDHRQHVEILGALRARDAARAAALMSAHLAKVRADLERWDPSVNPLPVSLDALNRRTS